MRAHCNTDRSRNMELDHTRIVSKVLDTRRDDPNSPASLYQGLPMAQASQGS